MKLLSGFFVAFLMLAGFNSQSNAQDEILYTEKDFPAMKNKEITFCGFVVQTITKSFTKDDKYIFLNFEKPYPNTLVGAMIPKESIRLFKGSRFFQGQRICIHGVFNEYDNDRNGKTYTVTLTNPNQLRLK